MNKYEKLVKYMTNKFSKREILKTLYSLCEVNHIDYEEIDKLIEKILNGK